MLNTKNKWNDNRKVAHWKKKMKDKNWHKQYNLNFNA